METGQLKHVPMLRGTIPHRETAPVRHLIVTNLKQCHQEVLKAVGVDGKKFQAGWNRLD